MSGAYWYGLLLVGGLFLLLTFFLLLLFPIHVKFGDGKKPGFSQYADYIGHIAISICFYLAWGFGLPALQPLHRGPVRLVFEIIFILCSIFLGLLLMLFYGLLPRLCRRDSSFDLNETHAEDNIYRNSAVGASLPEIPAAKEVAKGEEGNMGEEENVYELDSKM